MAHRLTRATARWQFGDRLSAARTKRGVSQAELSRATGIGAKSLSFYEAGDTSPEVDNLQKICTALHVSADYLLDVAQDDPPRVAGPDIEDLVDGYRSLSFDERRVVLALIRVLSFDAAISAASSSGSGSGSGSASPPD